MDPPRSGLGTMAEGWEMQKENIQPLSSGRNVSLLDPPPTSAESDMDIVAEQINTLERYVKESVGGEDPLEPHLSLIKFLDHQCLYTGTWKKTLTSALMDAYKTFLEDSRYLNDKRFVDVVLRCLKEAVQDPSKRTTHLLTALNKKGIGSKVAHMYIALADLQESLGRANEAYQTLKSGVDAGAEPMDKLQSAKAELEVRVAGDLAKKMKTSHIQEDNRNFGSSVPVYGDKNDAPVFRNDFEPAVPVTEQFQQKKQPMRLFHGSESKEPEPTPVCTAAGSSVVLPKMTDQENYLQPSRWNKEEVAISPERLSAPCVPYERIQIFTEDTIQIKPKAVSVGVLQERKVVDHPSDKEGAMLPESANSSTAHSSLALVASSNNSKDELAPMIIPNARLMCSRSLLPNGNPASFEHRKMDTWLKKNKDKETIRLIQLENKELELKLSKAERERDQLREIEQSLRENFETELKQKAAKEKQWEQHKYQYKDTIQRLTTEVSQLQENLQQMRLNNEEELENLHNSYAKQVGELEELNAALITKIKTLEESIKMSDATSNSKESSTPTLQPSSSSIEAECTFIRNSGVVLPPTMSFSESQAMTSTDRLLHTTGTQSFMAPPSTLAEQAASICSPHEPSFNASVRMGGTTTIMGWRDDKTKFCFNTSNMEEDDDDIDADNSVDRDATGSEACPSFGAMIPPPKCGSRKFVLYESRTENLSPVVGRNKVAGGTTDMGSHLGNPFNRHFKSEKSNPLSAPESKFLVPAPVSSAADGPLLSRGFGAELGTRDRPREGQLVVGVAPSYTTAETEKIFVRPTPPQESTTPVSSSLVRNNRDSHYNVQDLPFDTSNLTRALEFAPEPLLNSTPQKESTTSKASAHGCIRRVIEPNRLYGGNYIHTQRLPRFSDFLGEMEGPMSPSNFEDAETEPQWQQQQRRPRTEIDLSDNFGPPLNDYGLGLPPQENLSPIQETSRENRSTYTTSSSSSNNMTSRGGATMSGVSMFQSNSRSMSSGPGTGVRSNSVSSLSSASKSIRFNPNQI